MKPRTRLEKLVAGLSEKLPAITKAQEEWAKEHVFDHVAYKCKNELWCSECGEIWVNTGNSKLGDKTECPYCHHQLDVKVSRKQKNHEEAYMSILQGTALFVVVCNRHCIYKVPYNALTHTFGEPELFAGGWDESGYVNGSGVTARFDNPRQPAFDQDGNMFVPEYGRHTIRKITPTGEVSLYAGLPGQAGFTDGLPEKARFNKPECVTVYLDNSLYVADRDNHLIRRVTVE